MRFINLRDLQSIYIWYIFMTNLEQIYCIYAQHMVHKYFYMYVCYEFYKLLQSKKLHRQKQVNVADEWRLKSSK